MRLKHSSASFCLFCNTMYKLLKIRDYLKTRVKRKVDGSHILEHSLLFPICLVLEEMKMDLNITAAMMERFLLLQQFDECSMGTATSAVYSIFQPSNKPDWIEENVRRTLLSIGDPSNFTVYKTITRAQPKIRFFYFLGANYII